VKVLTLEDVANAPKRSFSAASGIAQDIAAWHAAGMQHPVGFTLGEKDDTDRDGSDAQLRDALCTLAGLKRQREAVLNEDGTPKVSAKRGKPQYRDIPFSTRDRLEAMGILGIHERELSRDGTKRIVALVPNAEDEDEVLPNEDEDLEESPED